MAARCGPALHAAALGAPSPRLLLLLLLLAQQVAFGSAWATGDVLGEGDFIDITATINPQLPVWESSEGAGPSGFTAQSLDGSFAAGDPFMLTRFTFGVHLGTHIDMPSHFLPDEFKAGNTAEKADLSRLMGPALVVEVPTGSNITEEVLRGLGVERGVDRLILKTDNTARGLLRRTAFDTSYTALSTSGARYLAEHTRVKAVGIDYLSIARYAENSDVHVHVLGAHIMVVESLVLDEVWPGWYTMACLPLKVAGVEGVPARCVLGVHAPRGGATSSARGKEGDGGNGRPRGGGQADVGEHYYYDGAYYEDGELEGAEAELRERMGYDPDDDDDAARYWGDYDGENL